MRLQKYLAMCGVASRRRCEELIAAGRVRVNGAVADKPGTLVDEGADRVEVDGRAVSPAAETACYMLHKEHGVVSTCSDPQGRPTVMKYFADVHERLYPVGRLDFDTEGLLLMTNDGALANRLTHPRYEVEKEYEAVVRGEITQAQARRLEGGVEIDGVRTAPAQVRVVRAEQGRSVVRVTIHEGRNRQVRKMLAAAGLPVMRLRRERIGALTLGSLKPGQRRKLSRAEMERLMDEGLADAMASGRRPSERKSAQKRP